MMLKRALGAVKLIAVVDFAAFAVMALILGGDAINGYAEAGRYYLSNHGRLTEVSEGVFNYSQVHAVSVFVLFGVGMISEVALRMINRREREAFERSTDTMLHKMRTSGDAPPPR